VGRDEREPDRAGRRDERGGDEEALTVLRRRAWQERVEDEDRGDPEDDRDAGRADGASIGLLRTRPLDGSRLIRSAEDLGIDLRAPGR
jgi:hypothetical protein